MSHEEAQSELTRAILRRVLLGVGATSCFIVVVVDRLRALGAAVYVSMPCASKACVGVPSQRGLRSSRRRVVA